MNAPATLRPRVAVIVLNFNGLDDTIKCLESLCALTEPVRMFLVDNASIVDPTADALRAYPGIDIIRTSRNLGYAGGNNRGIERALDEGADYLLILNNDTIVAPTIVAKLLAAFASDQRLGIVGPVINFLDEPACVMTDGVAFNTGPGTEFFHRIPVVPNHSNPPVVRVDIVNGCCMMIRADVIRSVGMFDETFFIVHEESDLCLRGLRAGFGCAVLGETLVWHKGSSSFERAGRQLQRYFDTRNLYALLKRHAGHVSGSRTFLGSLRPYLLYAFYRYCVEVEAGKPAAAAAVIDGVCDALRSRNGPYAPGRRAGFGIVKRLFSLARRRSDYFKRARNSP